MATASPRPRRAVKAPLIRHPQPRPTFADGFVAAATSAPARAFYVAAGSLGLLALAAAIMGPRRLERHVVRPLAAAIVPPADRLWREAKPVRDQIAGLIESAGPARDRLAQRLQSWIGHFRAT